MLRRLKDWGVPGFRSSNALKEIFAAGGYLVIAVWLLSVFAGRPGLAALGALSLLVVILATNGWNIRSKIPLFNSVNSAGRSNAVTGWVIVGLLLFASVGWAANENASSPSSGPQASRQLGVGGGAPATPSPSSASALASTTTASPTPAPTATPTPSPVPTLAPTVNATAKPAPTAPPRPTATAPHAPPPPPPTGPPVANTCGAPANPWGYNFCGGSLIYSPPSNFCSYFACIASFWTEDIPGDGYVAQCADGTYSLSGGERGACSYHGGVARNLYS